MYAVIATGGKQFRVSEGQKIQIEKMSADAGQAVEFKQILMLVDGDNVQVGAPYIQGAVVNAEVVRQMRGDKVHILKFRRRKHHMKQAGHRQYLTEVKITGINSKEKSKA